MRQNETPKRLSKRQLTDGLVTLILTGKTNMTENAKTLGIGRATAYRYWGDWVESDEAKQLDVEWWASFQILKDKSSIKAFEGLTRLKIRKTPFKVEQKTTILKKTVKDINVTLREYSESIERATDRNIRENNPRKQVDTAQAHA